ncbi:MAG: triose-phosphate isomerase [Gemmatimonadetes bacterium]|nr:triose-phosphate isomerase [Gemmatimonadota bacterium]MBI3566796.1 triose-phosphate isomerase [Gemmatimonadota bacterium]
MKHPVFAANWKMNQAPADAKAFMRQFLAYYPRQQDRTVLFFPSALTLSAVVEMVKDRTDLSVGVQNIHWEDKGAFTGENSATIARGAGARYVLAGHSERRHVFGETDEQTGLKVAAAERAGLTAVICVGETLDQRERGETNEVVLRQLRAAVAHIEPNQIAGSLVAYEPVWAIGTGKTATTADASVVHQAIRAALRDLTGERGEAVPILYGGSVNRGNAAALLAAPEVDGLLVGGASLEAENWAGIVRT